MWLGAKGLKFVLLKLHETNERVLVGLVLELKTESSNQSCSFQIKIFLKEV